MKALVRAGVVAWVLVRALVGGLRRLVPGRSATRGSAPAAPAATTSDRAEPSDREVGTDPRAERLVALLLVVAGALGAAFAILYVVEPDTQLLGLTLGLALALVAVAMVVASRRIVPREIAVQPRPDVSEAGEGESTDDALRAGVEGVSRRGMLLGACGLAAGGVGAAVAVPLASLGPAIDDAPDVTPWRRGVRVVDEAGEPVRAAAINVGAFLTGFPERADRRELGSPVAIVRVRPDELMLPPERADWAPEGILAFSKICTHAGCAVNLFRYPQYEPTSSPPGLVCPCHFSTFDVRQAAKVVFGPAARALPQLPLGIDERGMLVAQGGFPEPIGPSWWGVRRS